MRSFVAPLLTEYKIGGVVCDYPTADILKYGETCAYGAIIGTYTPFGSGGVGDGINLNQVIGAIRYKLIVDGVFTIDELAMENKPFTGVADPYFKETFTPALEAIDIDDGQTEQRGMIQYTIVSPGGIGTHDAYEYHRLMRNSLMGQRIETTKSIITVESVDVLTGEVDGAIFDLGVRINLVIRSVIS